MAYADYILSKRPDSYYSLDGASGNFNVVSGTNGISGTGGGTGYTSGTDTPIVAGYQVGTLSQSVITNTNIGCLSQAGATKNYSIELWGKLKVNPFYGYQNTAIDILYTDSPGNKIYIENSYITFLLTATDGTEYRAQVKHSDWDKPFHIVASYSPNSICLYVNGVVSDATDIDGNKLVGSSNTNLYISSTNLFLSNIAIYRSTLSLNDVIYNYITGSSFIDKEAMSVATGGNYYSLSKNNSSVIFNQKLYSSDFYSGNLRNIILQDDVLKNINYNAAITRDSSGNTVTSTTGASGITVGGTSNTKHCKIDSYPAVNSNSGFIGLQIPLSTGNSRDILTVSNKNLKKSWAWKLNSSSQLILNINQYIDNSGTPSTTASYTYSTALTSNNSSQKMWFIFDTDGIRVSTWSLTANTFNQYSSSDYINELVNIDSSTDILLGSDELYVGSGSTYQVATVWAGSEIPTSWDGTFSDLELSSNNNVSYNFAQSLSARTRGEFTYTFNIGMQSSYCGSSIEFDLNKDIISGVGSTVNLKYNNGQYYECTNGKYLPAIPYSGFIGDGSSGTVVGGPIVIQAILETTDVDKNLPELSYIDIKVYGDNELDGKQNLGSITVTGDNVSFRNTPIIPNMNSTRLNCTFSEPGYLTVPASTGNNTSIEFNFAYKGSPNSNSTIISAFDGNNKLAMSTTGLVSVSGWPSNTVYLNGRSIGTTGATAQTNSINHVLIVGSTGLTGPVYLNASVTGGGATGYFSSLTGNGGATAGVQISYGYISMWSGILTGATGGTGQTGQTSDIINSRLGFITKQMVPQTVDSFSIIEATGNNNPRINVTPWQQLLT